MINNIKTTFNIHKTYKRTYRKILGASIACLSMFSTMTIGSDMVDASAANVLQPEIVQAASHVPTQTISLVEKIKEEAVKHVGVPYVTGGTTTKGFDCSGFTQYVFKNAGIDLPRVSSSQATIDKMTSFDSKTTTIVNKNDIQAGDLIFFSNTPGRVSHVGIALEENKYIHASTSKNKITIANRSGSYYNDKFTKAIRVN